VEATAAAFCVLRVIVVEVDAKGLVEGTDGSVQFDAPAQQAGLILVDGEAVCLGKGAHGVEVLLGGAVTGSVLCARKLPTLQRGDVKGGLAVQNDRHAYSTMAVRFANPGGVGHRQVFTLGQLDAFWRGRGHAAFSFLHKTGIGRAGTAAIAIQANVPPSEPSAHYDP
jgi:hypothetical protein